MFYHLKLIVKKVCVCLPHRKSGLVASARREDTSSMPVQPVSAQTALCPCLPCTDVLKDLPGENNVADVI